MKVIAHIESDFNTKFGVPRQSGVIPELTARIIFEPEYRVAEAFRGLEDFTHIWILWCFSEVARDEWNPTVRPPRLGGNVRMGVFATRSPFRPNNLGLSCVRLDHIAFDAEAGPVIHVLGADLMDRTPIYDIKPYVAYADAHPDARSGFVDDTVWEPLSVELPQSLASKVPADSVEVLKSVLAQDPRPRYHDDPERVYGMPFLDLDIRFKVEKSVLKIVEIIKK